MRFSLLAVSLASALAARNATPGIKLTLQEMRRWMKGRKHGVDYRLGVSGLPKDKSNPWNTR
jgi:hypothetical protein